MGREHPLDGGRILDAVGQGERLLPDCRGEEGGILLGTNDRSRGRGRSGVHHPLPHKAGLKNAQVGASLRGSGAGGRVGRVVQVRESTKPSIEVILIRKGSPRWRRAPELRGEPVRANVFLPARQTVQVP